MHKPTEWNDRITLEDGKITRTLTAIYCKRNKYSDIDVYRETEDGLFQERNIYRSVWGGMAVAFPGLPFSQYDSSRAKVEEWCGRDTRYGGGTSNAVKRWDLELVYRLYPDFRYVAEKYDIRNRADLMGKLLLWKKHPEAELVLAAGYERIAENGNFWRMTEQNRKAVCAFMRRHPGKNLSLNEVMQAIRAGEKHEDEFIEYTKVNSYWRRSVSFADFLYLQKITGIEKDCFPTELDRKCSIFRDCLRMIDRAGHDPNDPYWRHPKDLLAMHERLYQECEAIREAERLAEEARLWEVQKAEIEAEKTRIKAIERKFNPFCATVDGYEIGVTMDYSRWQAQAHELHQCIITAGYYKKVIRGDFTIVFITRDGKPEATAEISREGKIGQFYANELDRSNCLPSPAIKDALNKWLATVPVSKFKSRKRKEAAS